MRPARWFIGVIAAVAALACASRVAYAQLQIPPELKPAEAEPAAPPKKPAKPSAPKPAVAKPAAAKPAVAKPPESAKPTAANDTPDLAYGAFQRGYFLTAFSEATKRIDATGDRKAMTL
jgi:hypothetical protein